MDTGGHSSQAEVNQEDEGSGEEGLEWDSPLDQGDIMDFSVTGIAEQLTRLDAVSVNHGRSFLTLNMRPQDWITNTLFPFYLPYLSISQRLFRKVVPYQCLGCVWSQRDKKENLSATVSATIAQFNAVTNRVITSLLCRPTSSPTSVRKVSSPAQRACVIEKWIRVGQVRHI